MPVVSSPETVLVTGASGFIGSWVVKTLLEKRYTVRATVQLHSEGEYLGTLFEKDADRFSFVVIPDIGKDGAAEQAVVGAAAVLHLASPCHVQADDPQEVIGPAVQGTTGLLRSIQKHAPTVKRVIILSSVASILHLLPIAPGEVRPVIDELCWNTTSPIEVEEKGREASGVSKYRTSKVLAERAAWAFVEENKSSITFDLVAICPALVNGPILHQVSASGPLNLSTGLFRDYITPSVKTQGELVAPLFVLGYSVDVRDVAAVLTLALANPDAGGERFLLAVGPVCGQMWLDAINAAHPGRSDVAQGILGAGKDVQAPAILNVSKVARVLNFKFRTNEEMAVATFESLKERGLLNTV